MSRRAQSEQKLIQEDIHEYLDRYQKKELLRFVTVGSVDDGKSTLIGRLLYDSKSVYEDQVQAVKKSTKSDVGSEIDFSLLTDGLKAEREQGITIDVAYRYFSTEKRKFIIADTPGHVQYTRNMATGASTAHVGIILIDARLGILPQSKRHAYIASLLGIPHLAVCVNKMDLKNYDQGVFTAIQKDFSEFAKSLSFESVTFFPISALKGDNIVTESAQTAWYKGGTLLNFLENVPIPKRVNHNEFGMPVQLVLRPHLNFRGFAGTIASGRVKVGDKIAALPSKKTSRVKSIETYTGQLQEAFAPQAVTLTLEDEIDISRGDMIAHEKNVFSVSRQIEASLVWLNEQALEPNRQYWIKHAATTTTATVTAVDHIVDVETLAPTPAATLRLNEIGKVHLTLSRPIALDLYKNNRQLGAFILIDRITNATVAAGMISGFKKEAQKDLEVLAKEITTKAREERFNQKAAVIWITGLPGSGKMILARALERRLFETGHLAYSFDYGRQLGKKEDIDSKEVAQITSQTALALQMGAIVILAVTISKKSKRDSLKKAFKQVPHLEIRVDTPVELCRKRLKQLKRVVKSADLKVELPSKPDYRADGSHLQIGQEVDALIQLLEKKKILR